MFPCIASFGIKAERNNKSHNTRSVTAKTAIYFVILNTSCFIQLTPRSAETFRFRSSRSIFNAQSAYRQKAASRKREKRHTFKPLFRKGNTILFRSVPIAGEFHKKTSPFFYQNIPEFYSFTAMPSTKNAKGAVTMFSMPPPLILL